MVVNADYLTTALADRLAAIVPAGFRVRASGGMLWYSADDGRFPGQQGTITPDGRAPTCGPTSAPTARPGTRTPPRLRGRIRGSMLHLWYGEPDHIVLACEPVPLAGILRPG